MIKSGIIAGLKPDEIRNMIPKDAFLVFQGWQEAHEPATPGSGAPTKAELQQMMESAANGNQRGAA
jgi:hypothetical protein